MEEKGQKVVGGTALNPQRREYFTYEQLRRWKEERDQVLKKQKTIVKQVAGHHQVHPEPGELDKMMLPPPTVVTQNVVHQPESNGEPQVTAQIMGQNVPDFPKSEKTEENLPPMEVGNCLLGTGNSNQGASSGEVKVPVSTKVKKPKGMQLDSVYKEYIGNFLAESYALSDSAKVWSELISEAQGSIPDEILGEIGSTLGQAHLLLDSKLPQFAELLYFYLSRTCNPHPILECDLDGWWAVAMMSITKVKDRFVQLETLRKNEWVAPKLRRR